MFHCLFLWTLWQNSFLNLLQIKMCRFFYKFLLKKTPSYHSFRGSVLCLCYSQFTYIEFNFQCLFWASNLVKIHYFYVINDSERKSPKIIFSMYLSFTSSPERQLINTFSRPIKNVVFFSFRKGCFLIIILKSEEIEKRMEKFQMMGKLDWMILIFEGKPSSIMNVAHFIYNLLKWTICWYLIFASASKKLEAFKNL